MNNTNLMSNREASTGVSKNASRFNPAQRFRANHVLQIPATDEFQHDVVLPLKLIGIVDRHDMRMMNSSNRSRFLQKSLNGGCLMVQRSRQHFDGDWAIQQAVIRLINNRHSSPSQLTDNPKLPDPCSLVDSCFRARFGVGQIEFRTSMRLNSHG